MILSLSKGRNLKLDYWHKEGEEIMRRRKNDVGRFILIMALIVLAVLWVIGEYQIHVDASESDPFYEPTKVRCTCYIDEGYTCSGAYTRPGIIAAKKEWIGCVAELNAINEDGSVGEFIGFYEILDTGYGIETGVGESKILKGRTLGTIETGETVDVWMPTLHQAEEWIDKYGDYVYIKIIRGEG